MAGSHPLTGVQDLWEDVIEDMEATAAEYREAGWEALELHPGDVTALPTASAATESDRLGLDVLLPGDEFRELEELMEGTSFDEYDAYRAEEGGVVFLVVAMKAPEAGLVVVLPLYYAVREAEEMLDRVAARGEMRTFLRPLDDSRRVVFSQDEPDNLLPAGYGKEKAE
ncbi:DUF7529 family protein [Halorarum salinum]|uniref:Uncharacterized protein n=1 Tax=Halorarum salinum TaxID=2743089 RepID=A0A7D5L8M7_9EURY|nr:hypothetical protein [Halobaculum salinum]QLG60773.1 hypothetical protein HUG12_03030 [Halobaculum salinum]